MFKKEKIGLLFCTVPSMWPRSQFLSKFAVFVLLEFAVLHFLLFDFPMLGCSVAHCSSSPIQLPLLVTVGKETLLPSRFKHNKQIKSPKAAPHLLMLTTAVPLAFFSTSSHSSSSPRILYLEIQSRYFLVCFLNAASSHHLILTLPGPFLLLSLRPACVSPQTL